MNLPNLPKSSGFFWWRESSSDAWRMVHVINTTAGLSCLPAMLSAYDVEHQAWNGRSLERWPQNYPVGEWVRIEKPITATDVEPIEEAIRAFGGKFDSYAGGAAAHVTWGDEAE